MNGALDHSDQPDPDAIKMFVGQIPRSWSEKELKELFEPYGAVYQINVLRDRSQNPPQSKGTVRGVCAVGGWGSLPGRPGHRRGREDCEWEPPAAPAPEASPAPPRAPARPPASRAGGRSGPGTQGRRSGGRGAAAPLSRRVIALPRSLSRQRRLLFPGGVPASLRNSVSSLAFQE